MRIIFASGILWWSVCILLAALAALLFLAYPRQVRAMAGPRWRWPFCCRVAAGIALFLLVARPEVDIFRRRFEPRTLLILLDRSASMGLKDERGVSRVRRAALAARDGERLLAGTSLRPLIIPFADARGAPVSGDDLLALAAGGEETDISAGLQAAAEIRPPVSRILILSDGNDTTGLEPVTAALALGVPVDTVAIGEEQAEERGRDLWLTGVDRRDNAPLGSVLPIAAQVDAEGYAGQTCRAILRAGEKILAQGEIVLDDQPGSQTLVVNFLPTATGLWDLTLLLEPLPGEKNGENNLLSFPLAVHERLPRVVYVEGAIRPDFKFLRRSLATDPGLEFLSLIRLRANEFLHQGEISGLTLERPPRTAAEWSACEALILGEITARELGRENIAALASAIQEGLGLLILASPATTGSQSDWASSPLAPALSALPVGENVEGRLCLKLTAAGREHPALHSMARWFEADERGLVIASLDRAGDLRPGAEVLLAADVGADKQSWPVLTCSHYGKGRVAVFWGREIWRWSLSPVTAAAGSRFWGQLVRWLAGKENQPAGGEVFALRADRLVVTAGEEVILRATARVPDAANISVSAEVKQPDGATSALGFAAEPGSDSLFVATFTSRRPGAYTIVAKAIAEGKTVAEQSITLRVRGGRSEFARLTPDYALLNRLAAETGGRALTLGDLTAEIAALAVAERSHMEARRIRLWHAPGLFLALALFLSAEWLLRKRAALP